MLGLDALEDGKSLPESFGRTQFKVKTVCDPYRGNGHGVLEASRRSQQEEQSDDQIRQAPSFHAMAMERGVHHEPLEKWGLYGKRGAKKDCT